MLTRPAALLTVAGLLLAGCGSDADSADSDTAAGSSASKGAFPVTVPTAFGDVTVEEEPTRVVALGWSDAETALALGVQPVGASDWLAVGGDGLGDWVEQGYDEAPEMIEGSHLLVPAHERRVEAARHPFHSRLHL